MIQTLLFESSPELPKGMVYQPGFIEPQHEDTLLAEIRGLPLQEAKYRQFTARRRIVSYGGSYDFSHRKLLPAIPIPPFLHRLREQVAEWTAVSPEQFVHALIAEYRPGTQLGWHRDVPEFEIVVGVSLGGVCRMRMRPYPPEKGRRYSLRIDLEPRSAYVLRDEARWGWQHSISPTKTLRYSITFRTRTRETKSAEL